MDRLTKVLKKIIDTNRNNDIIVGLTPKGLHDWYYKLIKKSGATVFELRDTPINILDRIVFYDEDSNLMEKDLTEIEDFFRGVHAKNPENYNPDIRGSDHIG